MRKALGVVSLAMVGLVPGLRAPDYKLPKGLADQEMAPVAAHVESVYPRLD